MTNCFKYILIGFLGFGCAGETADSIEDAEIVDVVNTVVETTTDSTTETVSTTSDVTTSTVTDTTTSSTTTTTKTYGQYEMCAIRNQFGAIIGEDYCSIIGENKVVVVDTDTATATDTTTTVKPEYCTTVNSRYIVHLDENKVNQDKVTNTYYKCNVPGFRDPQICSKSDCEKMLTEFRYPVTGGSFGIYMQDVTCSNDVPPDCY